MNIYLYELKANRNFILTWLIVIFMIVTFTLLFYPIFREGMDEFLTLINNLPESIRVLFGMNTDTIGSILGYYAFTLTFIVLCGTIEAMMLGLNILSKETREKTADFLLAKPVSRTTIITSKLLAAETWIFVSNILFILGFYLLLTFFNNTSFNINTYLLLTLTIFFLQTLFLSLGSFLAVTIPKLKNTISLALGTVFGFYLLSTFTDQKMRLLSPFKYFDVGNILMNNNYEVKYLIFLLILIILLVIGTYIIYNKKDIEAV